MLPPCSFSALRSLHSGGCVPSPPELYAYIVHLPDRPSGSPGGGKRRAGAAEADQTQIVSPAGEAPAGRVTRSGSLARAASAVTNAPEDSKAGKRKVPAAHRPCRCTDGSPCPVVLAERRRAGRGEQEGQGRCRKASELH